MNGGSWTISSPSFPFSESFSFSASFSPGIRKGFAASLWGITCNKEGMAEIVLQLLEVREGQGGTLKNHTVYIGDAILAVECGAPT
jgi:hypothetical protein